jgi:glycosyltransferase involved in cell wall biosynthesis
MIRLSVIIPAFNAGTLIAEAVRSVGAEERRDIEILVVDDGSTDGSTAPLAALPAVRVLHQPNRGPGPARNLGIREARGELLGFLDADDLWLPGRVEALIGDRTRLPEADLYYSDYLIRNLATGIVRRQVCPEIAPPQAAAIAVLNPIGTSTVVARRAAVEAAGGFREDLRYAEDWDLWLRIAERGPLVRLAGIWAEHRERPGSLSGANPGALHSASEAVLAATLDRAPDVYGPVARRARANLECRSGIRFYRIQDYGRARRHLWRSILGGRLRPSVKYFLRALVGGAAGGGGALDR